MINWCMNAICSFNPRQAYHVLTKSDFNSQLWNDWIRIHEQQRECVELRVRCTETDYVNFDTYKCKSQRVVPLNRGFGHVNWELFLSFLHSHEWHWSISAMNCGKSFGWTWNLDRSFLENCSTFRLFWFFILFFRTRKFAKSEWWLCFRPWKWRRHWEWWRFSHNVWYGWWRWSEWSKWYESTT